VPYLPHRPFRDRAQEHVKPKKSKVAGPVPRCCPCGGRPKGTSRVLSGWRASPKRPSRFARTASTRRASSSRSKPMRKSRVKEWLNDRRQGAYGKRNGLCHQRCAHPGAVLSGRLAPPSSLLAPPPRYLRRPQRARARARSGRFAQPAPARRQPA